jgi:hypothetical protein
MHSGQVRGLIVVQTLASPEVVGSIGVSISVCENQVKLGVARDELGRRLVCQLHDPFMAA